jgi:hypothetical protein
MPGRREFFSNKAKHSQRPLPNNQKPKPVDDSLWFTKGLEACRDLSSQTSEGFGKVGFASLMDCSPEEAERRLRVLTRAGFLRMSVERAPDGDFIRYVWDLR